MRIILWLATGIGAAAIATAAPARPGGPGPGHGGGVQGGWSNAGGHHGGKGGHSRPGAGWVNGGDHGRHHGRYGRDRQEHYPYGGGGIVGPVGGFDRYGNGFFTGGGGEIRLKGGRPHFDYDRGYPYEFASVADGREPGWDEEERRAEAPPRCTFESGVRVCRGW